jgi:hypothetical protein
VRRRAGAKAQADPLQLKQYEDSYRLAYICGPEGIIVELAERIG